MALVEWGQSSSAVGIEFVPANAPVADRTFTVQSSGKRVITLQTEYGRFSGGAATEVVFAVYGTIRSDLPLANMKSGADASGIMTTGPTADTVRIVTPVTGTESFILRLDKLTFPNMTFVVSLPGGNADDLVSVYYGLST